MSAFGPTSRPTRALGWYALSVLRLLVAGVLLATALGKSLDLTGFATVVGTYQALPERAWFMAGTALTVLEWSLGVWLLSGWRLPHAALGAASLHILFTTWAAVALMRGIDVPNCGCFGVFYARPLTVSTVFEDLFMLALCLLMYGLARRYQVTTQVKSAPGPESGGAARL